MCRGGSRDSAGGVGDRFVGVLVLESHAGWDDLADGVLMMVVRIVGVPMRVDDRPVRVFVFVVGQVQPNSDRHKDCGHDQRLFVRECRWSSLTLRQGPYPDRRRIMGAVFRIDELHHEVGDRCSCEKRLADCEEFAALNFIRETYYAWENRQIGRLNEGKPHGLPFDHPKGKSFAGSRWEWRGLPSTREED